jgi:hypothetical protein
VDESVVDRALLVAGGVSGALKCSKKTDLHELSAGHIESTVVSRNSAGSSGGDLDLEAWGSADKSSAALGCAFQKLF